MLNLLGGVPGSKLGGVLIRSHLRIVSHINVDIIMIVDVLVQRVIRGFCFPRVRLDDSNGEEGVREIWENILAGISALLMIASG